jgi:hypothetical protein
MARPKDPLAPVPFAAAVAPVIDRIRIAISRRIPTLTQDLMTRFEVPQPAMRTLGMLRNTLPDRVVTVDDICELFVYDDRQQIERSVQLLVRANLLEQPDETHVRLAAGGRDVVTEIYAVTTRIVEEIWRDSHHIVDEIFDIVGRAVEAAGGSGGPAFGIVSPPFEPVDAPATIILAERLTPLRFHRYDAHVAAWRAAGLTATEVAHLPPGSQRDEIEAKTNRLAAAPYAALDRGDRFVLLAGLGALPN